MKRARQSAKHTLYPTKQTYILSTIAGKKHIKVTKIYNIYSAYVVSFTVEYKSHLVSDITLLIRHYIKDTLLERDPSADIKVAWNI